MEDILEFLLLYMNQVLVPAFAAQDRIFALQIHLEPSAPAKFFGPAPCNIFLWILTLF